MTIRNYFRLLAEDQPYSTRTSWLWKPLLKIASFFYWSGMRIHRACYRYGLVKRHRFPRTVISVGNMTWGGTGKTPLVAYLAHFFSQRGRVPLILARGYGADETEELARKLPRAKFGFGKNRVRVGERVLKESRSDVIVLDDGFQHWPIERDLEVVVVNVLNPFGNSTLIPHGVLREPLSALKRASFVVLTDVNLVSRKEVESLQKRIHEIAPQAQFVEAYHEPIYFYRAKSKDRVPLYRMKGVRVTSFSGIGTPRSFQLVLNRLGVKTIRGFEFCDHHRFSERELKEIRAMRDMSESREIVTTEKDFYRSQESIIKQMNPLVLKVRMSLLMGQTALRDRLLKLVDHQPHLVPMASVTPTPAVASSPRSS